LVKNKPRGKKGGWEYKKEPRRVKEAIPRARGVKNNSLRGGESCGEKGVWPKICKGKRCRRLKELGSSPNKIKVIVLHGKGKDGPPTRKRWQFAPK